MKHDYSDPDHRAYLTGFALQGILSNHHIVRELQITFPHQDFGALVADQAVAYADRALAFLSAERKNDLPAVSAPASNDSPEAITPPAPIQIRKTRKRA